MSTKKALRLALLTQRQQLTEAEWERRSQAICQHVLDNYSFSPKDTIHIFLPIRAKRELDTWPLIHALWELEASVVVPVSDFKSKLMTAARLGPNTMLQTKQHGLQEPANPELVDINTITWVGVPLLAYDKQGHRLGYGGGFYDRFLPTLPLPSQKVGLSLFPALERIPEVHDHDVPLDTCISPEGLYTI